MVDGGKKFHYNPATGKVNVCTAQNGCPLRGINGEPVNHYSSRDEAYRAVETEIAHSNSTFSTLKKVDNSGVSVSANVGPNDVDPSVNGLVVSESGSKKWYKNGKLHRVDGPAFEGVDGSKEWYQDGVRHRVGGPAVETASGNKFWYRGGQLHREDGPAMEFFDGSKEWYLNGRLSREDGPAVETADGAKFWYLNGKRHRDNGPVVEEADGTQIWISE